MMVTPYRREPTLFRIAASVSALAWLALVVGTFGLSLLYLLFGFLFYLFVQSGFISHLKGNGVRITPQQYPALHASLNACCERTGVDEIPEAYVLRTDFFNALATRFLGRNFIVLYSDVLDALEERPGAVRFYIGHELGHIHRKHLVWGWFLWPAMILPLLGAALRRAEEYTCDRYGVACCESEDDLRAAMAAMAAGNSLWESLNSQAYLEQIPATAGFWMSFHELTSDYPWLTKRMATALALRQGGEMVHPRRNFFGKLLAMLVPRFGASGGAGGLILLVAIIGVLAAVAIPAYQDYTARARLTLALDFASGVKETVSEYRSTNGEWPPPKLSAIGYADDHPITGVTGDFSIDLYDEGAIGIDVSALLGGSGQYVVLRPSAVDDGVEWSCTGEGIEARYLPAACR